VNLITTITNFFANFSQTEVIMAIFLGAVAAVALVLRIILFSSYSGGIALINMAAKEIKTKADVEKLKGGTFARAAKEYAAMAAGGARADALDVARMTVTKNRLYFFNFKSMAGFIRLMEWAFLPFVILFVLASTTQTEFVMLSAGIFLLMIILAAVFDIDGAKDRYVTTLAYVLARDVGRLFPMDATSAVYAFGKDLDGYLSRQSTMYNEVLNKIKSEFTGAITANISAMAKGVDATLKSIAKHESLEAAISRWAEAVDKSASVTAGSADAGEKIAAASVAMAAYGGAMKDNRDEIKEDIVLLTNAVQKLNMLAASMEARNTAMDGELGLVIENQKALETAVASYETSLKEITAQMGDAMGKIVAYHLGGAGGQIADSIADSIKGALTAAAGREEQLKTILEDFAEQNRYQTKLLLDLKQRGEGDDE
jgi:hypothetical protein